jgi:hypothetical protein
MHTAQTTPTRTRAHRLRAARWDLIIPIGLFVLLTLAGVSFSSIGIGELRQDPGAATPDMWGDARAIRSDEWLTGTPLQAGVTASGDTDDLNPLTGPQEIISFLPAGPVSSLVLPDGLALELGPWLPDGSLVAARTWIAFLLLALGVPAWFRYMTGSRRIGWFAFALIALSPVSAWWSFIPVSVLGPAFFGAAALLKTGYSLHEGRRGRAVAWGIAATLALARTTLTYQPWAIVLVPAILVATSLRLVAPRKLRKAGFASVIAVGVATIGLFASILLESRDTIAAITGTIYPGSRVATGEPNPLQDLFAATSLGVLDETPEIVGSNASELATSFAVLLVWLVLMLAHAGLPRRPRYTWPLVGFLAVTGVWLAWSTVAMGTWGGRIPLMNLVPSKRAADVLGLLAVIGVCLVLPRMRQRGGRFFAVLCAVSMTAVSAYAGSLLRAQNVPALSLTEIWLSSLVLGGVVLVITLRPRHWSGYVAATVCAALLVWNANPVLFGLADLRDSRVASQMMAEGTTARERGDLWVTDSYSTDSLLVSTGVPALSGRQIAGPDREAWAALDPGLENENVWNRGAAFIWFQWTDAEDLTWSNPSDDVILISGSPCVVAERVQSLTSVVANHELNLPCLEQESSFEWGGAQRWVYDVRR